MKKTLFTGLVFASLLIVGCAQKSGYGADAQQQNSEAADNTAPATSTAPAPEAPQEATQEPATTPAPAPTSETQAVESGTVIGSIYFGFDKFNISSDMENVLDESVNKIKDNDGMNVMIEGNTDEFGSDEYNYALGTKRALSVKNALVVKGVDKTKIKVVSFGESKPICQEKNKTCYQKNRRSDIKLVK